MTTETLPIEITLDSTYDLEYDIHPPKFEIYLDKKLVKKGTQDGSSTYKIDLEVDDSDTDTEHVISIKYIDKTDDDVIFDENGIIASQSLSVLSITIDDFDLDYLIWSYGLFSLDIPYVDPNGNKITSLSKQGCTTWGWNGTYELKFNTPFYLWLLENLN